MRQFPLNASASVTLDGSGAGTVQLGPSLPRELWRPFNVAAICSAVVTTGTCQVNLYAGPLAQPSWYRDTSFSADTGDTSNALSTDEIRYGSYVWAVFSGGVAGAAATLTVTGTREVP